MILKRILLPMILSALCLTGRAQEAFESVFRVGGWWEVKCEMPWFLSDSGKDEYFRVTYSIPSDTIINGMKCLKLMETSYLKPDNPHTKLTSILRTEGNKVFFKENCVSDNWYILYDFDVLPDEIFTIHFMEGDSDTLGRKIKSQARYKEEEGVYFTDCPVWHISEKNDFAGIEVDESLRDYWEQTRYWIKGIGSASGVTNNGYFFLAGGAARWLIKAGVADRIIYERLQRPAKENPEFFSTKIISCEDAGITPGKITVTYPDFPEYNRNSAVMQLFECNADDRILLKETIAIPEITPHGIALTADFSDITIDRGKNYIAVVPEGILVDAHSDINAALEIDVNALSGIQSISSANDTNAAIYDIHGRRVSTPQPGSIYIINGKKIICPAK